MPAAAKQIDPNTVIPPAVRRAAEAAEKAHKATYSKEPDPAPTPDPQPAPESAPAPAPDPAPTPDLAPPVEVTPSGNPAPVSTETDWERRYKSMEGRYKRAENDLRAMSNQVASMQSLISTLQSTAPDPTPPDLNPKSLLTPEEISEYGSEFLGVVAKKAKEELTPEVAQLKAELARINKRLEGTAQSSAARARADLESTLDDKVPNWRDVNVAPEFHSWLALPDQYSGAIRHQLLTAAYEQNNTPRVLAFFKGFLAEEAATAPATSEPRLQDDPSSGKIPLENFAAPGRAKTAAAPSGAPAEKPTFTRAQIAQFYADSAAGRFRGREAEKNRIEAQIFDAEREGRIR